MWHTNVSTFVVFCVIVQNCVKNGQLAVELWPETTFFNIASIRHLEFKNMSFDEAVSTLDSSAY